MSKTLPLPQEEITLESALDDDDNMLQARAYPQNRFEFFVYVWRHRSEIETIVSYHLGLNESETCQIGEVKDWMTGSFNVCVPVHVDRAKSHSKWVIIRFPLPYKMGDLQHLGVQKGDELRMFWFTDEHVLSGKCRMKKVTTGSPEYISL